MVLFLFSFYLKVVSSTNGELAPDDPTAYSNTPIAVQAADVEVVDETKYVDLSVELFCLFIH